MDFHAHLLSLIKLAYYSAALLLLVNVCNLTEFVQFTIKVVN
jgi:hypothetical protein